MSIETFIDYIKKGLFVSNNLYISFKASEYLKGLFADINAD